MPYEVDPNNRKCVRKADSKKRVGCTKGSVKKYLTALHANVNESTELNESKYPGIIRKPKIGDRVIVNGWYGEEGEGPRDIVLKFDNELGTIVDVDIAPGLSFPSGGEVIISFDRWRLPAEDDGGFEYIDDSCRGRKCMQFSNLLRNDYDFSIKSLSKDMDVKDFNAFENLYESEDDLEWAQDVVNRRPLEFQEKEILIDIKDLNQEEREKLVDILGPYMDDSRYRDGEEGIYWENSCIGDKSYLKSKYKSISLHCGVEDQDDPFKAVKGLVCCLYYSYEQDDNKENIIPMDGRVLLGYNLNESEENDLAWAEDTVNADPTYRFNNLVFKPHRLPGAVRARLNFPNGHYISVVGGPHLYGDGVDTFEIWGSDADEPEGYLTKADVTNRMLDLQSLPPLEGDGTFGKEPITESEEWFEDVVSNPINLVGTAVYFDNGLSISEWRKFKELMRRDEIRPLTVMDLDDMDSVMEVRDKHLLFMIDEKRTVAFHNLDLIKKRMAQGQEYSDDPLWRTDLSFNDVREYFNTGIYRPIYGYDLTGGSITESEDGNLGWAQDIVNTESIDITKDKKQIDLLKVGSIISITGYWESLTFNNDKATIIESSDKTRSSLLKFDRVVESVDDTSHCGDLKHEKICECEHNNVIGKCWYTDISQMDSVIWYPYEYSETLNESEEEEFDWVKDILKLDLGFDDLKIGDVVEFKNDNRGYWLVTDMYMTDPNMTGGRPSEKRIKFSSVHRNGKSNFSYFRNSTTEYGKTPINSFNFFELVDRKDLKESEENDLEWAQDLVSNVDSEIRYSDFRKDGKLLPDGVILKITGYQDDIVFNDQECKVIRFLEEENDRYLCVFPEVISSVMGGYTHCGSRQDEEKCHCLEKGGGDGRCYEIEMDHMSEVYYYPNRLKLTNESEEEKPLLTEGRYDAITRKAVNDIMVVIKETANQVEFNQAVLPSGLGGDEEYTQEGMSFSIELNIHHQPLFNDRVVTKESDAYYVHTAVADEEDENVIMMTIVVDPSWEPQIYERLFYKLQEDIRHEIEHLTQLGIHRISDRPTSRTNTAQLKTTFGHHKHKLEVPALVHGFYRRAKLEKRPIDEVMIEDLDSEIERGNLTKRAAQSLLAIWVDYSKKNLPAAIYSQE